MSERNEILLDENLALKKALTTTKALLERSTSKKIKLLKLTHL
jgi:hypothetical protein